MRVAQVGLAVLKGTRHQPYDEVRLSGSGPVGDRLFCLVDPERQQVLKTVANPALLGAVVAWAGGVLSVELAGRLVRGVPEPTGTHLHVSYWGRPITVEVLAGPWAAAFGRLLGRPVLLARARTGDIVYGASVALLTTGSLTGVGVVGRDAARFRATFVLDTTGSPDDEPGAEQAWTGRVLAVGEALVRITGPVVRCGVVDLHPDTGLRDLRLLDALPRDAASAPVFGLQGEVIRPGLVRRGDPTYLTGP